MAKYKKISFFAPYKFPFGLDYKTTPYLTRKRNPAKIFNGDLLITKAKSIIVVADYPLSTTDSFCPEFEFEFKSANGFTKQKFYEKVRDLYSKEIYRRHRYYGVWGHCIGDLVLEYAVRRKNGKYYLFIGS